MFFSIFYFLVGKNSTNTKILDENDIEAMYSNVAAIGNSQSIACE